MKKTLKMITLFSMLFAMVLAVCACGSSPKTVEEYLDKHEKEKTEFMNAMEEDNDTLSIKGHVEGNNVVIESTFKETFDEATLEIMVPAFDGQIENVEGTYDGLKEQIADITKIDKSEITFQLIYYNGDGTEIWNHTF